MLIESDKLIEATNIYGGCIAEFQNVIPNAKETIKKIENQLIIEDSPFGVYWEKAQVFGKNGTGVISDIRTNTTFPLNHLAKLDQICNELNNTFYENAYAAVTWYKERFGIEDMLYENANESLFLLRYQLGEKYGAHYDGGTNSGRCVSPILYLNDDYEGGELEFIHHGIKIKPQEGSLFLFPSNYAYKHIAHPVIKGTKYAIVTFFHDREESNLSQQGQ